MGGARRQRSMVVPDPYAPEGVRPDPIDTSKQWPPATGVSGTPHRTSDVPSSAWNNAWSPDPVALHAGSDAGAPELEAPPEPIDEGHPETRPVPTRWTATGRRSAPALRAEPVDVEPGDVEEIIPGPAAFAAPAPEVHRTVSVPDAVLPAAGEDYDLDEDDDLDLRTHSTETTEVIWRAPDFDQVALAPAPVPEPRDLTVDAPEPYTGARPRRFAAAAIAPPVVEESEVDEDGPGAGRVRIVLSERRSTAHSSRGLSDVQDPGAVGTLLRDSMVRNQLLLALRVGGVALFGLGVLPALFMAVPQVGAIAVFGIRLPWLLLGFLVYPFLLGLGWWYVRSSESVEQNFAEDVTER